MNKPQLKGQAEVKWMNEQKKKLRRFGPPSPVIAETDRGVGILTGDSKCPPPPEPPKPCKKGGDDKKPCGGK